MGSYSIITVEDAVRDELPQSVEDISGGREDIYESEKYVFFAFSGLEEEILEKISSIDFFEGKRFSISHCNDTSDMGSATLYKVEKEKVREISNIGDTEASKVDKYAVEQKVFSSWPKFTNNNPKDGTRGKPTKRYFREEYNFETKFIWDIRDCW